LRKRYFGPINSGCNCNDLLNLDRSITCQARRRSLRALTPLAELGVSARFHLDAQKPNKQKSSGILHFRNDRHLEKTICHQRIGRSRIRAGRRNPGRWSLLVQVQAEAQESSSKILDAVPLPSCILVCLGAVLFTHLEGQCARLLQ
jgi:hypothetical protein